MNIDTKIMQHFDETARALLRTDYAVAVHRAVEILTEARADDRIVWLIGNGGSASTASHFANDLVKQCDIQAMCIMDMVPLLTAYANDEGWEVALRRLSDKLIAENDLVIAFSCSGESENIIQVAAFLGPIKLIVFTGDNRESRLLQTCKPEVVIHAHHPSIFVQETVHLAVCHAIVDTLRITSALEKHNDSVDAMLYALKQNNPYSD